MINHQLFQAANALDHGARRYGAPAHGAAAHGAVGFLTPAECLVRCRNEEGLLCGQGFAKSCNQATAIAEQDCFNQGTRPSTCRVIS